MMGGRHPGARSAESPLFIGEVESMPIVGRVKPFLTMNETTVCTVETPDETGRTRGAIALGISHHTLDHGFVVYQSITEAEAVVALLQNAIADARRIEAGEVPLAPAGVEPPVKH